MSVKIIKNNLIFRILQKSSCRCLSTQANPNAKKRLKNTMHGWQVHSYGELEELQFDKNLKIPAVTSPTEILVKVNASSVNPIDVAMINGYGSSLLNAMRCKEGIEFPLIFGRDFSGTIVQKGLGVPDSEHRIGDDVWGVVPVHKQGCHAEYVAVEKYCITEKPKNLNDIDASAILYAGLTAWSGLFISGQLGNIFGAVSSCGGGKGKKALVLGAAGGVGSIAIQILLAENAEVFATCATDAIPIVNNLGVETIFDYSEPNHIQDLIFNGPYDIILDCAGKGTEYANEIPWKFQHYVTFNSPLLKNIDSFGFGSGIVRNAMNIVQNNLTSISSQNGAVKWGYFMPAPQGIQYLKKLAEREKLLPVIQQVYKFENTVDAYKRIQEGHLRGKIVIDLK